MHVHYKLLEQIYMHLLLTLDVYFMYSYAVLIIIKVLTLRHYSELIVVLVADLAHSLRMFV